MQLLCERNKVREKVGEKINKVPSNTSVLLQIVLLIYLMV